MITSKTNDNRDSKLIIGASLQLLILLFIIQGCSLYHDTYDAEGYVVDAKTRIGIEGASVTLSSGEQKTIQATGTTNSYGFFNLHINLGFDSSSAGILLIDKLGYKNLSKTILGFSSSINDTFELEPSN